MELLSFDRLRKLDIVDFLAALGIHPQTIKGNCFFYCPPLPGHPVSQTSFVVSRTTNRWREMTSAQSHDLPELVIRLYDCTIHELSEKILTAFPSVSRFPIAHASIPSEKITIEQTGPLRSGYLDRYLWCRRIALFVAHRYCVEASYTLDGRSCQALAFRCDAGGYALYTCRHHYSVPPNSPTLITGSSPDVVIFQDVFDLMTFATLFNDPATPSPHFLVLNATTPFPSLEPLIRPFRHTHLFLPNDIASIAFSNQALTQLKSCVDHRSLYHGYASLNDWACRIGTAQYPILSPSMAR